MRRSGFTMIELVFIIVILGILAAVAVPKMAASREDAKIVSIKQDIGTITQAIPAMAMSQGSDKVTKFSDAVSLTEGNWKVSQPASGTLESATAIYSTIKADGGTATGTSDACVFAQIAVATDKGGGVSSVAGVDIGVKYVGVTVRDGNVCKKIAPKGDINVPLTGRSVKFE